MVLLFFFFSSRRRHTRFDCDWSSDVCSSDLAGRAQEQAELEAALIDAGVARQVRVLADGEVALATAFGTGPGILVNAGTGSIAYARDPAGELHRAGGDGWQLGDEGGGYWLGGGAPGRAGRPH